MDGSRMAFFPGRSPRNVIMIDGGKFVIERIIEQLARVDIGPAAFAIRRMEFKPHSKNARGVGDEDISTEPQRNGYTQDARRMEAI